MTVDYEYVLDDCDVPKVRHGRLREYRLLRSKCLDRLRGPVDTSIATQIANLGWHTAVFRTLNEARRIEPMRNVNGALWELATDGYAHIMTLGIRKLVDTHDQSDSVPNVIKLAEQQSELLTREMFVCYDGLPYGYEAIKAAEYKSITRDGSRGMRWGKTRGPTAWATSERMHKLFDRFAGNREQRRRDDRVSLSVLSILKDRLSHPAIKKVCTFADKRIAHAERLAEKADPVPVATYNDIDAALREIIRVASFLSSAVFCDGLGSVVPTPQFDVLQHLDQPWTKSDNLAALQKHWDDLTASMDSWERGVEDEIFSIGSIGESSERRL